MDMLGEERPGEDAQAGGADDGSETLQEVAAIGRALEDSAALEAPSHHVVEAVRRIEAGAARHRRGLLQAGPPVNNFLRFLPT
jgi:hypothetical protein